MTDTAVARAQWRGWHVYITGLTLPQPHAWAEACLCDSRKIPGVCTCTCHGCGGQVIVQPEKMP